MKNIVEHLDYWNWIDIQSKIDWERQIIKDYVENIVLYNFKWNINLKSNDNYLNALVLIALMSDSEKKEKSISEDALGEEIFETLKKINTEVNSSDDIMFLQWLNNNLKLISSYDFVIWNDQVKIIIEHIIKVLDFKLQKK